MPASGHRAADGSWDSGFGDGLDHRTAVERNEAGDYGTGAVPLPPALPFDPNQNNLRGLDRETQLGTHGERQSGTPTPVPGLPHGGTPAQQAEYGGIVAAHNEGQRGDWLKRTYQEFANTGGLDPETGQQVPFQSIGAKLGAAGFPNQGSFDTGGEQADYNQNFKMASQARSARMANQPGDTTARSAAEQFDAGAFDPNQLNASVDPNSLANERAAQHRALSGLEEMYDPNSGSQVAERAGQQQLLQRQFDQQAQQQRGALEQNAREHGMGNGGLAQMGALMAGQNSAQATNAAGVQLQTAARQRALQALGMGASQANTMRNAEQGLAQSNATNRVAGVQQAYRNRQGQMQGQFDRNQQVIDSYNQMAGHHSHSGLDTLNDAAPWIDRGVSAGAGGIQAGRGRPRRDEE